MCTESKQTHTLLYSIHTESKQSRTKSKHIEISIIFLQTLQNDCISCLLSITDVWSVFIKVVLDSVR